MPNVDDRVVSIQFDNASFEKNVATTLASLEKLKTSLQFSNTKNSMADVSAAAKSVDLNPLGSAVDGLSAKFIAFSTIAITALSNITNRAVDAGIRIAKSLSLEQVMSGFGEYETNMNSIQTILANTSADGTNLNDVTAALDELNHYSDQTIYNFSEMAKNIGTFTAAGVDLDTATGAIKGIANLAAISGSSSLQASSGMYQLSQALASGTLRLMDWNSVQNAGMGGEVFQRALFETGKALGTIENVAMDTTFDQWTAAGNTFRASLESGWVTADVLTNTLAGFTGDLSRAQILSMGYTEAQADEIIRLGQLGKESATKVKTLTQLFGTVKEAIGSGWSKSFQLVIGDFEEAKGLFSYISESIGSMVSASADARNVLLGKWKAVGGRTKLLLGLKDAVTGIGDVLKPIAEAFRDIFPPMTAVRLVAITDKFAELAARIQISGETAVKLHQFFRGLFAIIDIGWEVLKGLGGAFADIVKHFVGTGDGLLNVGAKFGRFFTDLHDQLVNGGGIADFFDKIPGVVIGFVEKLKTVLEPLADFKDKVAAFIDYFIGGFTGKFTNEGEGILLFANKLGGVVGDLRDKLFGSDNPTGGLADGLGRVTDRLDTLKAPVRTATTVIGKLIDKMKLAVQPIENFVSAIGDQLAGVWDAIADAMDTGEYDKVLDLVNTGLLGGIVALLMKFVNNGIGIDIGDGFISKIGEALDGLTGTLEAMQTKLKSEALLNIGKAIALIVASVVILSLIDSEALTKGMTALAVGFGQLIGAMAALNAMSASPTSNASLTVLAAGLVILAGAILIIAGATAILASLNWDELFRGLTGVAALMGIMVVASKLMEANEGGIISAGAGMILMAGAINILAIAAKIFATMTWDEILKGLTGVAGGLIAMSAAAALLPKDMMTKGMGIVLIAGAMILLAEAMKMMSGLSWEEIGKGLAGVGGGLAIMVLAMRSMPKKGSLLKTAASLLLIAAAIDLMAVALIAISFLSWEEIAKGLTGIGGALLILALAANAMSGALPGALAIAVTSVSLLLLAKAMKTIGKLKLTEIGKALLGLAGVFVVLGLAGLVLAPLVLPLLGLGVALLAAGAGLILFGAGAVLVAKAFFILAEAGKAGVDVLMAVLDALLNRLPEMAIALALGLVAFVQTLADNGPILVEAIVKLIASLIDGLIVLAPKLGELLMTMIDIGVKVIGEKSPEIIEAGLNLLIAFLTGVRDNIGQITTLTAEIIIAFLEGITAKLPDIIVAAVDLLVAFIKGITDNLDRVIVAGTELIVALIEGIGRQMVAVTVAAAEVVVAFITEIGNSAMKIVLAGTQMIIDIIQGIGAAANLIVAAGAQTLISFLQGISDNTLLIVNAAMDIIIEFINGLADAIETHAPELRAAGLRLGLAIVDGLTFGMASKASSVAESAVEMGLNAVDALSGMLVINSPSKVFMGIGQSVVEGFAKGMDNHKLATDSVVGLGGKVMSALETSLATIPAALTGISEFNPVISPVLDLTGLQQDAKAISGLFGSAAVAPQVSYDNAKLISTTEEALRAANDAPVADPTPTSVNFEQNIYSPTALSVGDIYKQTRSQITLAKLELSIP